MCNIIHEFMSGGVVCGPVAAGQVPWDEGVGLNVLDHFLCRMLENE